MNSTQPIVGSSIILQGYSPSLLTQGCLNSIFLQEEKYTGGFVPIIATGKRGAWATVRLPSGHELDIKPVDVVDLVSASTNYDYV
jgi:hypothetical protein